MLDYHKEKGSDCTIAVINVPIEEASRFGIMNTNPDNSVYEFEEKPKQPKSTNASMGIYIFNWQKLRKYLIEDEADPKSSNDFGKNIIPNMLKDGQKLFAYNFEGYWKDVGTIASLWEANMDIINEESGINLDDNSWKIYARNTAEPPHYIGQTGKIVNSLVTEGCEIEGTVINSVISSGVRIAKGAYVENCNIMPNAHIEEGADVRFAIVGQNAVVNKNAKVGDTQVGQVKGEWQITVVGPNAKVKENEVVPVKAMVD